MNEEKVKLS